MFENVRLHVPNMTNEGPAKDYFEAKKVEPKSNQSAPSTEAMTTVPTTSKPTVVVEKKIRGFKSH